MKRRNRMGKLGAATDDPTAVMADLGVLDDVVNGPEDLPDWDAIAWRRQEEQVRRYDNGSSRRRRPRTGDSSAICRS
jgi:hypothetical protein